MTLDPDFLYPIDDDGPITFFCQNALNIVQKYQAPWMKLQNDKWSSSLKSQLKVLDPKQFILGFPFQANSRGLYCFGLGEQLDPDSYDEQRFSLGLVYLTGKVQLQGDASGRYGDLVESGFYLHFLTSLFKRIARQDLATSEFTANWPEVNNFYNTLGEIETTTPSTPPNVVVKPTKLNPDAQVSQALTSLGLQASLQLDLIINPENVLLPA